MSSGTLLHYAREMLENAAFLLRVGLPLTLRPRPHKARGIWKRRFSSENASSVFPPHTPEKFEKRTNHRRRKRLSASVSMRIAITLSAAILDLCLRKTRADKSPDYRDVIVFEKLRFQNVFRPHENTKLRFQNVFRPHENTSCVFKTFSVHTKTQSCVFKTFPSTRKHKAAFSKRFPSTRKHKAEFSNSSVFEKLRFRWTTDFPGLVWTEVLTGETKLRFQIPPV